MIVANHPLAQHVSRHLVRRSAGPVIGLGIRQETVRRELQRRERKGMLSKTEPGMKVRRGNGSNKQGNEEWSVWRGEDRPSQDPKMPLLRMAEINVCGGTLRVIGLICEGCNNT